MATTEASAFYDQEAQYADEFGSDDKFSRAIRFQFIRKVYCLIAIQLAFSAGFSMLFMFNAPANLWLLRNAWILPLSSIVTLVSTLVLVCVPSQARKYPWNYLWMAVFTAGTSVLVAFICASEMRRGAGSIVAQALVITAAIVFGLTLFSFQTKHDFTSCVGVMFVLMMGFFVFVMLSWFFPSKMTNVIIGACGAVLFSFYLIIDTQLVLGRGVISFSEDDVVIAAITIYTDIINIFLYILRLLREQD
eukprot:GHVU01177278.1.p1 GENE.GHVU01177278.1~~GHVU01177278.1.p1  ORF type:complete len:248 (-),score=25.08 GHVU01177278.1:236-979(-)